ncbi:MAG: aminotransferase class V-fold PLP-dependent enzyme [Christensenellales bacterium]
MIYLDNGATTNKKPFCVRWEVLKSCFKKNCANPNRSGYKISSELASKILNIRENLAKFFNCENVENVIFTSGCTEALNLAILGTHQKNGHVITTIYEHNSVLRPLHELSKTYHENLTILTPAESGKIDPQQFEKAITDKTYLVTCIFTSNVTGFTNEIEKIGEICKRHNVLFLVDCAQSAGHEKIDMQKMNIDFLSVAGHKGFYALTGVGALLVSNKAKKFLKPLKFGGTGTQSNSPIQPTDFPDGFESGTCNVSGILSLGAGLKFVEKYQQKINNKIESLTEYLIKNLKTIDDIIIYPNNNRTSGVVSFNLKNIPSNEVGNFLSEKFDICVRTGLHCAPLVHKHFGTLDTGMVRVSLSYFNKKRDIDKLVYALKFLCD